jgi:4-amino-4-deoxy-L-arabinose transferase-like glycosyltransferase
MTADESSSTRTRRWVAPLLLVLVVSGVFLAASAPWIGARFGESHDGRNAAVWGSASRAMREDGVIASRFGGFGDERTYANHPPGIIASTYVAERLGGERRIVTRAPAWIASIATVALLVVLLVDAGFSTAATAAGVIVACTSAMFLVYGSMLDTPVTALPYAVAAIVVCQRAVQDRPPPWWLFGLLGAAVGLSGWQAVVFVGFAGAWMGGHAVRHRRPLGPTIALAVGVGIGLAVTFSWIHWVYGGFAGFTTNARYRSDDATWGTALHSNWVHLLDLLPYAAAIGVVGLVAAVVGSKHRGLALVTFVPVVVYAAAFRGGSEMHDYWNFAFVVPFAVGVAVVFAWVEGALRDRFEARTGVVVVVLASLIGVISLAQPSNAGQSVRSALGTPALVDAAAEIAPAKGPVVAFVSAGGANSPWIHYESHRDALVLADADALHQLALDQPGFPVLVFTAGSDQRVTDLLQASAVATRGPWSVVTAAHADEAYELHR